MDCSGSEFTRSWNFPDISGGIETWSTVHILAKSKYSCWNFPDISGEIETLYNSGIGLPLPQGVGISQTSVVGLRLHIHAFVRGIFWVLSWNFPDISGGIETPSLSREKNQKKATASWNFPDISGGIETFNSRRIAGEANKPQLEFPRHQWWD